jgi:filamentous hemagglutinin
MASSKLTKEFNNYLKVLKKKFKSNKMPATAIGAEYLSIRKKDFSGPPPDINSIAPKLKEELCKIGKIGYRNNVNTVGCCCEVRSANKILGAKNKLNPSCVTFTKAIRPRTGQVIQRCQNCVFVFGVEI